jgi:5-formaminoimidazole-4-carboxamide-1-beta-D-ribofuranosyl 5'-monophosphate synthetase
MEHEQVPVEIRESVSKRFLERPERFIELASSHLTAPDEYGVLCLTESPDSDLMWKEYANNGAGFVVAFDTSIPEFESLRKPGELPPGFSPGK